MAALYLIATIAKGDTVKLLAVNGSPRKTMNTGLLLEKIVDGAASKGATAECVHLRDLTFKGCMSCFHCKDSKGKHYGKCAVQDGLTPVLQKAHEADVLVLGSPFYFSMETALMRACMERLWFQYYLYTTKKPPMSPRKKATALVYTMNVREADMVAYGKDVIVARSKGLMERFFAPCEVFLCCDTKQVKDYSKYEFDVFDVPSKLKRHDEIFPKELERAFDFGVNLVI
ncbi:MAG: flavodoxin family protein [Desulfovibrio sp.]|jgi:multimeric flavodoxin WrbA|nr:flavodoxin family protein [Desulfovibrio sp.]